MPLYRLDYTDDEHKPVEAVPDVVLGGDYLAHHMQTARKRATQAAELSRRPVLITAIVGSGRLRGTLVILPDGTAKRPPDSKAPAQARDDCKRDSGETCFCPPCRAERRASR